jgi:hypothetical protein
MITTHKNPIDTPILASSWWFVFDENNNVLIDPNQCEGIITSPHIMIVADSLDECKDYIDKYSLSIQNT